MPLNDTRYPRLGDVTERILGMVRGRLNAAIHYLVGNPELADQICRSFQISSEDDHDREKALTNYHFGCLDSTERKDPKGHPDRTRPVEICLKKATKWIVENIRGYIENIHGYKERDDAEWGVRYSLALIASYLAGITRADIHHLAVTLENEPNGQLAKAFEWCRQRIPAPYTPGMNPAFGDVLSPPTRDQQQIEHELGLKVDKWNGRATVCGALMLIGRELVGKEPIKSETTAHDRQSTPTAKDHGGLSGSTTLMLIIRASKLNGLMDNQQDISSSQLETWLSECSYYWAGRNESGTNRSWTDIESRLALDDSAELSPDLGEQEVYLRFEFDLAQPLAHVSIPLLRDALRSGIRPIRLMRIARINILASADALKSFTIT